MAKNLVIVESPAKAKTIEKILGSDFVVKSSYGHVRDLIKDSKDKKAIDVENKYKTHYSISSDKQKVVKELKSWVKKVDDVWLATDEDREGEAISWHLAEVLKLDVDHTKRIAFREITKPALKKAIENPRRIDIDLVFAQQARRVLDRLVGFELSGLLWRKIKGKLSAGRVQSVAVKLVAERERSINAFTPKDHFNVHAIFKVNDTRGKQVSVKANLLKNLPDERSATQFLESVKDAIFTVTDVQVKPQFRKPAAPFTTSTLQQDAARKFGFSVSRTMSVAQRLYEAGHITYMRTDSTNMSNVAIASISTMITEQFGEEYLQNRSYKNKSAGAQEAHEAIRPTYVQNKSVSKDRDEQRLYELIWKRAVSSQMASAKLEKTVIDISPSTDPNNLFRAEGQIMIFDGFLKLYIESKEDEDEDEDEKLLPPITKGEVLDMDELSARQRFTKPPAHYTEASLVKKLEELGIGRPSTYAPTISKIMDPNRGYVVKKTKEGRERSYIQLRLKKSDHNIQREELSENTGFEKNKLFATDLGLQVTDFLADHFADIMNYDFTASIEERLDKIASGGEHWVDFLDSVYVPFHEVIEHTLENAERVTGERVLGKDPKSGLTLLVRIGRYGPIAQIGTQEELGENKPQYANLKDDQSIETIDLEEALTLFQFPKTIGQYEEQDVIIGEGRYGPFVKFDNSYISIPKGMSPHSIDLAKSIELINEKRKADMPIGHYEDKPITKGSGRFGPFVKWNNKYVSITKGSGFQLDSITEDQAVLLIKAKLEKEANKYIKEWNDEGIQVENGRWGPFIRFGKKNFKLLNVETGKKMTLEEAQTVTLDFVKDQIRQQGGELDQKGGGSAKKTSRKKPTKVKK